MKELILSFVLIIALTFISIAQAPAIQWQRSLGGSQGDQPYSSVTHQTPDGGSIHVGISQSNDGDVTGHHGTLTQSDVWVFKLDSSGYIDWQQSYGGSTQDVGADIISTIDGGYIVCGNTSSNDGDVTFNHGLSDVWVVKLDVTGAIEWQQCYGSPGYDFSSSIQQTPDSGYIVLANTDSIGADITVNHGKRDLWLFKISSSGTLLWQKSFGGSENEQAEDNGLLPAHDGGFYITGYTYSDDGDVSVNHGAAGTTDYWLIKTDNAGNLQWEKTFGGTGGESISNFSRTADGGLLLSGSTNSPVSGDVTFRYGSSGSDIWMVKTDSLGTKQWVKTFGGSMSELAGASLQTADGGYLVLGMTLSNDYDVSGNHGIFDVWLVKTDASGNLQWQSCYGGSQVEFVCDLFLTDDGGLLFSAFSVSNDGDVSGHHGTTTSYDCWIVKLNPLPTGIEENQNIISGFDFYPNPAASLSTVSLYLEEPSTISIRIFDLTGREIEKLVSKKMNAGLNKIDWNINGDVSEGMYIMKIEAENYSVSKKISVIR